jgi:asparagine synthase (glutamine-hydrolysing)
VCGIFGILNHAACEIDPRTARAALDQLQPRGPDDLGWYESEKLLLGHTRLSIMDLSDAGHQPMSNDRGTIWVTFNGEIYGFGELRQELEALGHVFRSRSDTEVIVRGYEQWGRDVLERLRGMFAFALWDGDEEVLLLARDHLGKKPLFVCQRGPTLGFCSQLRPLVTTGLARPLIRRESLREFLFLNYVVGPKTILRDVELLPAGTWLEIRPEGSRRGEFWSLERVEAEEPNDPQARFEALLVSATRQRMVSDAPIGIFLSGGIDSAVVAAIAQREGRGVQSTFTVGFDEPSYDERPKARRVAERLGTDHHELRCRPEDLPEILPQLTASADCLLADQSMIPLARLAVEARGSVKVVLTGDGGDELLAGYPTYRALRIAAPYIAAVPRALRARLGRWGSSLPADPTKMSRSMLIARFLGSTTGGIAEAHASWRAIWSHDAIDALLGECAPAEWRSYAASMKRREGWSLLQSSVYADISTWLVDSILAKVDRATMSTGLEARSPLLDARLVEYAFGTLLAGGRKQAGKIPLRRLAASLLGPEFASTKKEGFQTPLPAWFAGPLRSYVEESLAALQEQLPGVLSESVIRRVQSEHLSGSRDHGLEIWSLVALSEWTKLFPGLQIADDPDA